MKTFSILFAALLICAFALCAQTAKTNELKDLYLCLPLRPEYRELACKIQKRDGTNFWGVYLGMIVEPYGTNSVMMFSAYSGECLRYISRREFTNVYVLKNKPEYPVGKE